MDRRKFLQTSGASLGGFLINPAMGVLGAVATGLAGDKTTAETAIDPSLLKTKILIRAREAANPTGKPFGDSIAAMALLDAKSVLQKDRFVAVIAHDKLRAIDSDALARASVGISIVEIEKNARGWAHAI